MDPTEQEPMASQDNNLLPEMGGGGLSEEEMRTNLQNTMAKLQDKHDEFENQQFSSGIQNAERRSEALSELFTILESKGVDPENPEEIRRFLDGIRETNPEIADQIEKAIIGLLGEEETEALAEEEMTGGLNEEGLSGLGEEVDGITPEGQPSEDMNINNNEEIQQNI